MNELVAAARAIAVLLSEHGYTVNANENKAHADTDAIFGSFHIHKSDGLIRSDTITIIVWANPSLALTVHRHGQAGATLSIDLANPKAIDQLLVVVDELTPLEHTAQ